MKRLMLAALFFLSAILCAAGPVPFSFWKTSATGPDITSNLLVWLKVSEGTGTTAADSSGNGHTGTLVGGTWVSGPTANGALSVNFGDHITVGVLSVSTSAVTFAIRVKPLGGGGTQQMIGKGYDGTNTQLQLSAIGDTVRFGIYNASGGTVEVVSGSVLSDGTWAHVAGTYDGTNYKIYINGALVATQAGVSGTVTGEPLFFGAITSSGSPVQGLHADFYDCRVYNRALSAADIAALYANNP